jgi:hypothetical protein
MSDIEETTPEVLKKAVEKVKNEIDQIFQGDKRRKYSRFFLAALGSIPWVGGFLGAMSALDAEKEQGQINEFLRGWLEEHKNKIDELRKTLSEIFARFEKFGEEIQERVESPQYLDLIRKGFRSWDQSDTQEKRDLIRKLLTNAGATKLCPDDLVRLFIDWIDQYHEAHFSVIKEIYKSPGITRAEIWDKIHVDRPREDSSEADLYKLLIRDLSMGSVIRQHRETNYDGQFKKQKTKRSKSSSGTLKSAFDSEEPYELTELGKQFVHYTMEEVVPRIGS